MVYHLRGRDDPRGERSPKKKRQVAAEVNRFLSPLFKESGSDVPSEVDFTLESFRKYKGEWLLYRAIGHETDGGAWVSPLSFEEAKKYPKEKLDVFQGLDYFLAQMRKHKAKKSKSGRIPTRPSGSKRFK